jgi:hypothetical protein
MPFDFLPTFRERGLAWLLRYDITHVLNDDLAVQPDGESVDYAVLAGSGVLLDYRKQVRPALRGFDPRRLETDGQRLAFWINLYNLLIIDAVLAYEVKESVTEGWIGILRFFRKVAYNVGGYRFSCEEIEQGLLRSNRGNPYLPGSQFGAEDLRCGYLVQPFEPLIHFGLNCASRSCPALRVFNADDVHAQLADAVREFLVRDVEVDPTGHGIRISMIFRWFGGDFGGKRALPAFIEAHLPAGETRDRVGAGGQEIRIRHRPYDWRLNRVEVNATSHPVSLPPSASPTLRR